jgi:hypothetical protein
MKRLISIILFFLSIQCLFSQYSVNASYLLSDVTINNIGIDFNYNIKDKHQFGIGLKYHFNNDSTKMLYRYYYQDQYSDNFINKIGLTFEYRFKFRPYKTVQPYVFYNFQFLRIGSKFHLSYNDKDSLNQRIRVEKQYTFDPINYFENHIGFGLNININKYFAIYSGISTGITVFTGLYDLDDLNANRTNSAFLYSSFAEFSWLFNTGITYKINSGKERGKRFLK